MCPRGVCACVLRRFFRLSSKLDAHHANDVLGKVAAATVETHAAGPRAARSDRWVGETDDGLVKTAHVGGTSVQQVLGAKTEGVAVDPPVGGGQARVLLPLLHVAVVLGEVLDRSLVVVEQNRTGEERRRVMQHAKARFVERYTLEVEPVVTQRRTAHNLIVSLADPDDLLNGVVVADAVLLRGGGGNVRVFTEVLHLAKDVLVLAVGERATFDLVEIDVQGEQIRLAGRVGYDGVAGSAATGVVQLIERALVDDEVDVVPVEADHGKRLFEEVAEPEAEGRVESLGVLACKHALDDGVVLADHAAEKLCSGSHGGVDQLHVLAGVFVEGVLPDLHLSVDDLGMTESVGVPRSRDWHGDGIVHAGAVVGDGSDLVVHVNLREQIAGTWELGLHASAAIAGVAAERHLQLGNGEIGVAGIASLPKRQLVRCDEVRVLWAAHADLNHASGCHV